MFTRIKQFFDKTEKIQTPDDKRVKQLIRKSQKNNDLTLGEINFLLNYCLGEPVIETTTFKFHDSLAKHMVFALKGVFLVVEENNTVSDIRFSLDEILLGGSVAIDVSYKDLQELMLPVVFKIDPKHVH